MSIASDARYRSILVSFINNEQDGSELVQLIAKPSGGIWAVQRTFPVASTVDQEIQWETALPLTLYDVALRYVVGRVAAVGYESSDPDAWTSPHAAGSKATVTTTSAPVTGLAGTWQSATGVARLTWSCAQQEVPFLIQKSVDGVTGWTTVTSGDTSTSYNYTPPGGELNTTMYFRVTPKRGSIEGEAVDNAAVYLGVRVGTAVAVFQGNYANTPGTAYRRASVWAGWTRGHADDVVDRIQVRSRQVTPSLGAWVEGSAESLAVPAREDVLPQPDGFVPVRYQPTIGAQHLETTGTAEVQVRVGASNASSVDWTAWVAAPYPVSNTTAGNIDINTRFTFGAPGATYAAIFMDSTSGVGLLVAGFVTVASATYCLMGTIAISTSGTIVAELPSSWRGQSLLGVGFLTALTGGVNLVSCLSNSTSFGGIANIYGVSVTTVRAPGVIP